MLENEPRGYSWGSRTLIPALQGRPAGDDPEAEVWFGDHPADPAALADGRSLEEVRAARGPLPFLLKILAASSSLSIQAHPSRDEAQAGFAREEAAGIPRDAGERTYRDANHKPEIIVALSDTFRALVGLRPLEGTRDLLARLGDRPGILALAARLAGDDEARLLKAVLGDVLSGGMTDTVADLAAALADPDLDAGPFEAEIDVLRGVARDFPGDPGLVVALLMNLVVLHAGEGVFAPAGVLHAYQDGLGVELMAASDNVLRGGLTPKHVDVAELLRVVDTTTGSAPVITPRRDGEVDVYDVPVSDFVLERIRPGAGLRHPLDGPAIVLGAAGTVEVSARDAVVTVTPGHAAYADDEDAVLLRGDGTVFLARGGR